MSSFLRRPGASLLVLLVVVLLVSGIVTLVTNGGGGHHDDGDRVASACAAKDNDADADKDADAGKDDDADKNAAAGKDADKDADAGKDDDADKDADADGDRAATKSGYFSGPAEADADGGGDEGEEETAGPCDAVRPESFADLSRANSSLVSRSVAPGVQIRSGAYRSAVVQGRRLSSASARDVVNGTGGSWSPFGDTPLETGRTEFDTSNGSTQEGLGNVSGRVSGLASNADGSRLFAAAINGGVWESGDLGGSWHNVSAGIPTQIVSSVAYSSAGGGTIFALTGDGAFGGDSGAGLGLYRSGDDGATWTHAVGIPDGLISFKVAVDPTDADRIYAATGGGLFRSTDDGVTFTNVNLPTGAGASPSCTGQPITAKDCFLANEVTDVVIQGPANTQTTGAKPGAVMAAVGWRAGEKANKDGSEQSPNNGIYESDSGDPGSFKDVDIAGNIQVNSEALTKAKIGRVALGVAAGPTQDHNVVYAIVQDANKFNGGAGGLDVNEATGGTSVPNSDYLNAVYASTDFGASWHTLEGSSTIDTDSTSGSALAPPTCKAPAVISYCPGIQAWYNLWISPDPTAQDASGVPSRVAFGLEEVWADQGTSGVASTPVKFSVIGRYFAGSSCTLLNAANGLPVCPFANGGQTPPTTTHPDQHAAIWVPDGKGGVTLVVGNDGGVYTQHVDSGADLANTAWGTGANTGLHTTQPYDEAMAKDGTLYAGLQDNGEMKIDPDGRAYTVFGGDGFFSAVDPDNSNTAYEEYTGGGVSVTKDGGKVWTSIDPTLTSPLFSTPFEMDAKDASHLIIGGRDIQERIGGADGTWVKSYDLGTQQHPGDASATASATDPANQLSAVDTQTFSFGASAANPGPKTADVMYTSGGSTAPNPASMPTSGTPFVPGTYDDHPFTIGPGDGDASVKVNVSWANATLDWDLYVYKKATDGTLTLVGSSATSADPETVTLGNPSAGDYVVRVQNYTATGTFDAAVTFTQAQPGASGNRAASYVGYCGFCDTITQGTPFGNGLATNVDPATGEPGVAGQATGWHIAKAQGLPSRYITSVRVDDSDPRTVYVTLAGYGRRWAFPGAVGEDTSKIGTGHVFRSTDAGESFTDVTGNLPDVPANWSVVHKGQLVVGTDIGTYIANDTSGCNYAALGSGLPTVPVYSLRLKPGDQDLLIAATYGRGIYTYRFPNDAGASSCPKPTSGGGGGDTTTTTPGATPPASTTPGTPTTPATPTPATPTTPGKTSAPVACVAGGGFKSVSVTPQGRGLKFTITRKQARPFTVDVFQQSEGRRVLDQRLVARFTNKTGSFTWAGTSDRKGHPLTSGYYFVRVTMKLAKGADIRRVAFSRLTHFTHRPDFYARAACKVFSSLKLSGPTWGGTAHRPLGIAYKLLRNGKASILVKRGNTTIKRTTVTKTGTRTRRLSIPYTASRPGSYTVTVTGTAGSKTERVTLTTRRI